MNYENFIEKHIPNLYETIFAPTECPYCHKSIDPIINGTSLEASQDRTFGVLFQCPSCKKYFFEAYSTTTGVNDVRIPIGYKPTLNLNLNIPEKIKAISPKFVEIYTQALTAEHYELNKISGIALRKAIEFLIKDYLINYKKHPEDKVKKLLLGAAINLIDNPKIQVLARATSWIGNDETHYERRYEDKDVDDMKRFITALLHFISLEFVLDEATSFTAYSNSK